MFTEHVSLRNPSPLVTYSGLRLLMSIWVASSGSGVLLDHLQVGRLVLVFSWGLDKGAIVYIHRHVFSL